MKNNFITSIFGTTLSAVGTSLQPNEVLETISMILTIIGAVITLIIIPLLNWYKTAKKDGKIDKEEIKDGINIIKNGVETIVDKNKKEDK